MPPTIQDVAREAKVSPMSVSLAFQANSRLSNATRERILAVAGQLGYVPNRLARQLRRGRADAIGFLVNDLANPFYGRLLKHVESAFPEYDILAAGSNWDAARERKLADRFASLRLRGVLVASCEKNPELMNEFSRENIPCVAVDSAAAGQSEYGVFNDLEEAGTLMADHFADIGVTRPVLAGAPPELNHFSAFRRLETSFRARSAYRGIMLDDDAVFHGALDLEAGRELFARIHARHPETDGIFCMNDLAALGVMEAAQAAGREAGRDFALAGVDDLPTSALSSIGLSSIAQDCAEMAQTASKMLKELISGHAPEQKICRISQKLIIRNSSGKFAGQREKRS